jgi:hypothetical protein
MTPLQRTIEWLEQEKPNKEEIQVSVDNLCHLRARPPAGTTEVEIDAAIKHLMIASGGSVIELVLPETVSRSELDYGPLVNFEDARVEVVEAAEARMKRFRALKDNLLAPF